MDGSYLREHGDRLVMAPQADYDRLSPKQKRQYQEEIERLYNKAAIRDLEAYGEIIG